MTIPQGTVGIILLTDKTGDKVAENFSSAETKMRGYERKQLTSKEQNPRQSAAMSTPATLNSWIQLNAAMWPLASGMLIHQSSSYNCRVELHPFHSPSVATSLAESTVRPSHPGRFDLYKTMLLVTGREKVVPEISHQLSWFLFFLEMMHHSPK